MKAIQTRFLPQTKTLGHRVKAFDQDGNSYTLRYCCDHSPKVHQEAAIALCKKMGWEGTLRGGTIKDGMVFVFI